MLSLRSTLNSPHESCLAFCCWDPPKSGPEAPACMQSTLDCLLPSLCKVAILAELCSWCAGDNAHKVL